MNSLLIFFNKNENSDLSEQLIKLNNGNSIELKQMRNETNLKLKKEKIEIIQSIKPGVGKSKYIKSCFENNLNKFNYIYFPVGGDLNLEDLIERLKNCFEKTNIGLHIDIYDCDNEDLLELINQFLFSFLIMNYYSVNENIFFFKEDEITIKIEVPSNFNIDFFKFPMLNYFNTKIICKISIEDFRIISKASKEKEQIKIKKQLSFDEILKENNLYDPNFLICDNFIILKNNDKAKLITRRDNFLIIPKEINEYTDFIFNCIKIPNEIDSDIQIVCNYLNLLKKKELNNFNIFVYDSNRGIQLDSQVINNTIVTPEYINYLKRESILSQRSQIQKKKRIRKIKKSIIKRNSSNLLREKNEDKNINDKFEDQKTKKEINKIGLYKKVLLATTLLKKLPYNTCEQLLLKYFIEKINDDKKARPYAFKDSFINNFNKSILFTSKNEFVSLESFYQITSFINLFSYQLKNFSSKKAFYTSHLNILKKGVSFVNALIDKIRPTIIEGLINNSIICSKSAFSSILKTQNETLNFLNKNVVNKYDEKNKQKTQNILSEEEESFNLILKDKDLIILNERNNGITIISELGDRIKRENLILENKDETIKKKFELYNFINSLNPNKTISIEKDDNYNPMILNYNNLKREEYINEIKNITCSLTEEEEEDLEENLTENLGTDYVFTKDNFIKMVMINLRMNAKVPLIIMGETGCGKTSLIKALASLKKVELIIFNIHAGIDNNKILDFVKNNNLLEEEDNKFKKSYDKINDIWVFLDEFNTSNSLGLFSEMMIKRTILGKNIKKNVSFIAACNPYKKADENKNNNNYNNRKPGISANIIKNKRVRILAYSVNPLPYSLLNYVFSFNQLDNETGGIYIENMVKNSLKFQINFDKKIQDINIREEVNKLVNEITNGIIKAHEYLREKKGNSSVSLRDVNRLIVLFEWILEKKRENLLRINYDKLKEEREEYILKLKKEKKKEDITLIEVKEINDYNFAIILSIYVTYFFRLDIRELREELNKILSEYFQIFSFEIICKNIVKNLVNEIEIEKGIAKNRSLLENLFALFICINNKIPLFLCGKPGCSKSLSLSIINKAMRGKKSISNKFKDLPEIVRNTYQGSLSSTSEGILEIFNNTRKYLRRNNIKIEKDINILKSQLNKLKKRKKTEYKDKEEVKRIENKIKEKMLEIKNSRNSSDFIFMIYFDEMGLAEISPNNPLKVIHSQLEYEKEEEKLAFVGISNWTLDASKMNRGIYLAVPEHDEKDCIETAIEIANSYMDNLGKDYEYLFTLLSESYINFINEKNQREYTDFHGARDFYHVIKLLARKLIENINLNKNFQQNEILRKCIQRNFGGYYGSVNSFENKIREKDKSYVLSNTINITECIEENILDNESRYLMIISDISKSQFLIQFILKKLKKENIFLLGSHFMKDLKNEEYTSSLLQKIQISMKNGEIVVMNNLESIYPSLYDLFNQTFTNVCGKKYARITIGSSTDQIFEVDNNFKSIVLVDYKKIEEQDRPFLNRFEKQIFFFKNLLNDRENNFANNIYKILNEVVNPINNDYVKPNKIDIRSHLINFDEEEIKAIVYDNKHKKFDDIKKEVFNKIVPTFTQDIMVNIFYSSFSNKYNKEFKEIVKIYENKPNNLSDLIYEIKNGKNKNKRNIVFTFSRIFDGITDNENEIDNKIISKYDYEKLINEFINKFYNSEKKILVIQIKEELSEHLNHIINLLDIYIKINNIDLNSQNSKYIIIIIHLQREVFYKTDNDNIKSKSKSFISHLSFYNQVFIDNLKGKNISITKLYNMNNNNLFNLNLFDKSKVFETLIYEGFMRFSYKFLNELNKEITEDNYHEKATTNLKNNNLYLEYIENRIIELICKKEENSQNNQSIILSILTDIDYQQKGIDYFSDIKNYMRKLLLEYFIKFIYKSEKDAILPSILFSNNKKINETIINYIKKLEFGNENPSFEIRGNTVNIIFGLNLPLIYPFLNNLKICTFSLKNNKRKVNEKKMKDIILDSIQNQIKKK